MSQAARSIAAFPVTWLRLPASRADDARVLTTVWMLVRLGFGCSPELPDYLGPLCDKAASGDWSPAVTHSELDHVDHVRWIDDPELEAQLLTYGMDEQWERLSGSDGYRTDVFEMFYGRNVVSRAGFVIHEVGHAAGLPCHVGEQDRSWEDGGAYRLQLEFLAAVYYAEGLSQLHKAAAKAEFTWIMRYKFVDATGLSLDDFG